MLFFAENGRNPKECVMIWTYGLIPHKLVALTEILSVPAVAAVGIHHPKRIR